MGLIGVGIVLVVLGIAATLSNFLGFTLGIPLLAIGVVLLILGLVFWVIGATMRGTRRAVRARL